MKIHMVKKGDTLYEIANKYNVDLDKLIANNPQITDPNVIDVGMKVKIPNAPMPVIPPTDYLHKHVVVQGDTLWKLGKSWNVPLQMLITANPQLKNPNILMTGEVVYIPKVKLHHESHQHQNDHPHHAEHHYNKPNTAPINKPNTAPIPVPLPAPAPIAVAPAPIAEKPQEAVQPSKVIPMPEPIPNIEFQKPLKPAAPYPEYLQPESYTPPMKPMQQEQPQYLQPESYTPPMKPMQQEQPQYLQPESYTPPMKPMPQEQPQYLQPESYTPPMKPMQQEQPQFLQPENQYAPPMMPIESMNTYPWHDNNQGFEHGTQAQMWGHSHHDMNLFQQYQEPAAEVFTHDYMNAPQHSMWSEPMLSPFAESPYGASMPAEASFGGMPNYPFYQQPQQSIGDCGCGCGGPVMHTQAMPYPYAMPISQMPNAQMPNAQMPNAQMPNAQMPNAPMPYGTWPTAQSPVSYGEMPVYTQGYEPMAANSAYPGSVYPMSMHPAHMVQPYGWSPYGAGMHDCGCNSRYELEQLLRQQSEAEAKAKAEISTNADASEEKKLTVQNTTNSRKKASISTKAAKPAQRNRRSTQKTSKASTNSPWLVR